jgi:hypothetical protein
MEIDKPKGDSFHYHALKTPGFEGINGDGTLNLVGFTARNLPAADGKPFKTELYFVNARPSLDPTTGSLLDNSQVGPNMTIEAFTLDKHSTTMHHTSTYHHDIITTPNNIAIDPTYGIWFTNDHGTATHGLAHHLAPFTANGDVSYCSSPTSCRTIHPGLKFPNGLHLDASASRIYVPSAWIGGIRVYKYAVDRRLQEVSYIDIPYPIDNLSQDSNGDIWAAGIPKGLDTLRAFGDPLNIVAASAVFRVRRGLDGWEVVKVLEDRDGEILPGATTVVHDVKSGRIFVSGVTSPFITVCDPTGKK